MKTLLEKPVVGAYSEYCEYWCTLTFKLENISCARAWPCVQSPCQVIIAQLKLNKIAPKSSLDCGYIFVEAVNFLISDGPRNMFDILSNVSSSHHSVLAVCEMKFCHFVIVTLSVTNCQYHCWTLARRGQGTHPRNINQESTSSILKNWFRHFDTSPTLYKKKCITLKQ